MPSRAFRTVTSLGLLTFLAGPSMVGAEPTRPLSRAVDFEKNEGQFDPAVRFVSRTRDYTLFLTDAEAVVALRDSVVRLSFDHARPGAIVAEEPMPGTVNYLLGRDPASWRTGIRTYRRVTYNAIYPGVDLTYYSNGAVHEYDLVVAPGVDPSTIALRVSGADRIDLDGSHVRLATAAGVFTMRAPVVYQMINGTRRDVAARYALGSDHDVVRFDLGPYDASVPVVIDPELVYGTYLGGTGNGLDTAAAVTTDASGAVYLAGGTETTDFPTQNPIQSQRRGQADAMVVKLSPDGQRVYATYLGGGSYDGAAGIAVRSDGVAYVVGSTSSDDFPVRDAYQSQRRGSDDLFLVELNREGTAVVRGTYLGGSDTEVPAGIQLTRFRDEAPPAEGEAPANEFGDWVFVYGATKSPDFPTINPAQGRRLGDRDAFVTVLERNTLRPGYSTYIGGDGDDTPEALLLKRARAEFYVFLRRANDEPPVFARFTRRTRTGALGPQDIADIWGAAIYQVEAELEIRAENAANVDAQVKAAKPLPCEEHDVFTQKRGWLCHGDPFPGPPGVNRRAVSSDELAQTAFVMVMPGCLPVPPARTCTDRAVLVFYDADVKIITHLNFGGARRGREFIPTGMAVDKDRRYHFIGTTSDNALPVVNPVQSSYRGSSEGFVLTLDPLTGETSFFSYLGGSGFDTLRDIAIDKDGYRWIVGDTLSNDFPTTRSGVQPELRGRIDAFVVKITP